MIYTVTFNPSLDHMVRVTDFELGKLHRSIADELNVGGKGINVTAVLKQLGMDSIAFGFVSGFTGYEILDRLTQMKISHDFIMLDQGNSRINIKLLSGSGLETEINGQGPLITIENLKKLYRKLEGLGEGDVLVLSGSVPGTLPNKEEAYAKICEALSGKKLRIVIDAEGECLRNTLQYHPFLIKPNQYELGELFGHTLHSEERLIQCGRQLQQEGAQNILISMGGEGALLLTEDKQIIKAKAPKGQLIHSVGAGDAMVAGFLTGLYGAGSQRWKTSYQKEDYEQALYYGIAAGSAAAFSEGYPTEKAVLDIYNAYEFIE